LSKRIFLSAGDFSGDVHCGLLAQELKRRHPDWQLVGLGGRHMAGAGTQIWGDTSGLGVIGWASAMSTLPRQLSMRRAALRIYRERPDCAVLCDWGGFNSRLIDSLKALGCPVLYYFPPRSWQKHGEVNVEAALRCDRVATPFPWSARRLKTAGANVTWVGHPLLETRTPPSQRAALRNEFGVGPEQKLIALLPGSRALELRYIAPAVAGAVQRLAERFDARFVAAAPLGGARALSRYFSNSGGPEVLITEGRATQVLAACDAAIVKSGTSTLEAAVAGAPQVVPYNVPLIIRWQINLFGYKKRTRFVSMPNIILERPAVTELLGPGPCRPEPIANALAALLTHEEQRARLEADYAEVREALGEKLPYTATARTGDLVEELVAAS
jgi:lipid-A-disaccharide synthase